MKRRTFLQRSTLIIPGLSAAGLLGIDPQKLVAGVQPPDSFSLSVVTDRPEKAVALVQELLDKMNMKDKNIRYSEYILHGDHVADIAYTRAGRLIDFHKAEDSLSAGLRTIAARLDLPRSCENPLLSHFSCDEGVQKPAGIRIFKDEQLILEKTFPVYTEAIHLEGVHGKVVLEMTKDHAVRFAETSCKHKTCMNMGAISQAGQNLVCIPNRISVSVMGTSISAVDSVTF